MKTQKVETNRLRSLLVCALGVVLAPAIYVVVGWDAFSTTVLHPDDVSVLYYTLLGQMDPLYNGWNTCGRPLQGLIHLTLLGQIDGYSGFVIYRYLGVAGLAGLAGTCIFVLKKWSDWSNLRISLAVVALLLTPPFPIYAFCAHFCEVPIAAIAALLAGHFAWLAFMPERRGRAQILVIAAALLFASLHLHQAAVGFALIPPVLSILTASPEGRELSLRPFLYYSGLYVAALAAYWVYFNTLFAWIFPGDVFIQRGGHPEGFLLRPFIYLRDYVLTALAGWRVFEHGFASWLVPFLSGTLFLLGCLRGYVLRGHGLTGGLAMLFVLATVFMVQAPMLAAQDYFVAFRLMAPLYALMVVVGFSSLDFLPTASPALRYPLATFCALWLLTYLVGLERHIPDGLIKPQALEYERLNEFVHSRPLQHHPYIVVYPPLQVSPPATLKPKAEYGFFNTAETWVGAWYLETLLRLANPGVDPPIMWQGHIGEDWPDISGHSVLLDPILLPGACLPEMPTTAIVQHPILGPLFPCGDSEGELHFSPWLGELDLLSEAYIRHPLLGVVQVNATEHGGIWFHSESEGWFWGTPREYPYFHYRSDGTVRSIGD